MGDILSRMKRLLDATPGGYISKAKISALLERCEEWEHADHPKLWSGNAQFCACGAFLSMATVALGPRSRYTDAMDAALSAYAEKLATDDRLNLNACIAAAVDAALREYGIPIYRSADEVWAAYPDACRDCDEPKPPPPGALYGWTLWVTCGWQPCRFGHDHHGDEIPIG